MEWLERLEAVTWLRRSAWGYALVNGTHILGLAILVGTILNVDLRLIGLWRGDRWREALEDMLPVAKVGFALTFVTGLMLFSVKATRYMENPLFLIKMGLVVVALANILLFHRVFRNAERTAAMRWSAAASLILWVSVLGVGRAIAFF